MITAFLWFSFKAALACVSIIFWVVVLVGSWSVLQVAYDDWKQRREWAAERKHKEEMRKAANAMSKQRQQ